MDNTKWYKYLVLGLLYGYLFQVRPVFVFVPFIKLAYNFYKRKEQPFKASYQLITIVIFIFSMMPYAMWNKANNGVFSVTSLEGGGGIIHEAQWSFKLTNKIEYRYFFNLNQKELISETDPFKVEQNLVAFNKEWDYIDSACHQYVTAKDSALIDYKNKSQLPLWITYNAQYVLAREKLLKKLTLQHYKEDILYTIKAKAYTFFRIWYTGLFSNTVSPTIKYQNMSRVSPYVIVSFMSFSVFLIALIFLPIAFIKNRKALGAILYPIILLLYIGAIHTPFAIQSRYTVPARFLFVLVIAYSLAVVFLPLTRHSESKKLA